MKQKILFGIMVAIIFGSLFVGLRLTTAVPLDSMWLAPEFKTVDPTPTQMTFLYDMWINTTYDVTGWEAKLLFDPSVLRALDVVWGTFMTGAATIDTFTIPGTGETITLSQTFSTDYNVTGVGLLAQVNFTFVLPGATEIQFLISDITDRDLVSHTLASQSGKVKSNMPRPSFYWYTDDGINPLPNHTISEGGDTIWHHDVVHFNASASYDVCNLVWDGDSFEPDGGYPDIVSHFWDFGDGTNTTTAGPTTSHVYQDYRHDGYLVNLTVTDSEAESWSTTWMYPAPVPSDTVPMWRDVAVVDFWPSLMPFEIWNNGTGPDWWAWWWYDTVDFTIPRVDSYYWNYEADNIFGGGSHARDWGIDILMTFGNAGSVPELCKMSLYAIYLQEDLDFAPGPVYTFNKDTELILIRSMTFTIAGGSGTGWGWALEAPFMPTKNGYYILFATIELEGAMTDDQIPGNNYMAASKYLDTIYSFGVQSRHDTYAKYRADLDGNGKVGPEDLAIFSVNFGGIQPPKRNP